MVSEIRGERSGIHRHTHTNNSLNWGMGQEFQLILIFNSIYILFKIPKGMSNLTWETHGGKVETERERVALGEVYR